LKTVLVIYTFLKLSKSKVIVIKTKRVLLPF
jgi:hypothetical protein